MAAAAAPRSNIVIDANDGFWRGQAGFTADIAAWKGLGLRSVLLLSGDFEHTDAVLGWCDADDFQAIPSCAAEIGAFVRQTTLPDTQAAADTVVNPIAAMYATHPSVRAINIGDEPPASCASRLLKVLAAFKRELPTLPVVCANIGLANAGPIERDVPTNAMLLTWYPFALNNPAGQATMDGFGYAGLDAREYVRQIQSEAGEPKAGPHKPLWLIAQTHNFTPVPASIHALRTPSPDEIRQQYQLAWELGATEIFWFIWYNRAEPNHSWVGLESLPALQQAISGLGGSAGAGTLALDYNETFDQFWARSRWNPESSRYAPEVRAGGINVDVDLQHGGNIQAALDASGPWAPVTFWLGAGPYPQNVNVVGHRHKQWRAKAGVKPVVTGQWRIIPTSDANYYHGNPSPTQWSSWTDMVKRNRITPGQGGSPQARAHRFLPSGNLWSGDLVFWGLDFNRQGQRSSSLNLSSIRDVVVGECDFQGMIVPLDTTHPGNISSNAMMDNVTLLRCRFLGRGAYGSGTGDRPRWAVYIDGGHGIHVIDCEIVGDNTYSSGGYLFLVNDDYTLGPATSQWRMAQFVVVHGGTVGQLYNAVVIKGRRCGVRRLVAAFQHYGPVSFGDKPQTATMYALTNVGGTLMQTVAGAPNNPIDMGGEAAGNLPKFAYDYAGNVIERNDVNGAGELVTYENIAVGAGLVAPELGPDEIRDNVFRDTTPVWFNRRVAPTPGPVFTAPTLSRNTTSGSVPALVPYAPVSYPYLEPTEGEDPPPPPPPPPPPADCSEYIAEIAVLEALASSLQSQITAFAAENADLEAQLAALDVQVAALQSQVALLAADRDTARGRWAGLRTYLEG